MTVIVVSFYTRGGLLETDVIESGERGAVDVFDGVIGHQKVLLPPHEHVVRLVQSVVIEVVRVEALLILMKRPKLTPMFFVDVFVRLPFARQKGVFFADDFSVEVRRQGGVFVGQTLNLQVTTKKRVF